jgi:hypothetical protein
LAIRVLLAVPILLASGWACLALWLDAPGPSWLRASLAVLFGALAVAAIVAGRRARLAFLAAFALVLAGWLSLPPRQDRPWLPDVARPAYAEIEGDRVTLHNVRDFTYRSETDYEPRWETRTLDLAKLEGVDLFLSYWGPTLIAHTIMSWQFSDGQHLAVSIETRKEEGEAYSALKGFFRQFELYYVVADERDVVALRTNHRGEQVFLYRLAAPPERARRVLLTYLEHINELAAEPRWYNALTHNCTTSIRLNVQQAGGSIPWDWRFLVNGRADELLYERGSVNRALPFAELRARSDVTSRARAAGDGPDFSARIREGLPARPPPPAS